MRADYRNLVRISDIFNGRDAMGETNLRCPCGHGYTHIREVFTRMGSDEFEAKCYPGTVVKGSTPQRRSALVIVFVCEDGHKFEVVIQQHKGLNMLEVNTLAIQKAIRPGFTIHQDDEPIR